MPTGTAMAMARAIEQAVSSRVVGMRSMTSPKAGVRWKNELPKLPVAAFPKKRANWTGSGCCRRWSKW